MSGHGTPHPFTSGLLTQAPPTDHLIFPFTVSGTQLSFLISPCGCYGENAWDVPGVFVKRCSWPNTLPSRWTLSTLHTFSVLYFILIPMLYSFCFLPFLAFPLLFWPFLTSQPLSDINAQAGSVITHLKFVLPSRIFLYHTHRPCKENYLNEKWHFGLSELWFHPRRRCGRVRESVDLADVDLD